MYYVYAHTKPGGEIFYIGKGTRRRAWDKDNRNQHWHNIVQKYGFESQILAHWPTEQEAFEHEKFLIACFRDLNYKLANVSGGGEGAAGYKHTEEAKKKMSEQRKGFGNGMFGKKRPEITGENHHMHNPKIAQKVSEKIKGGLNPSAKKVKFDNKIFNCIVDLANYLGLNKKTIQKRVRENPQKYGYELI